MVKPRIGIQIKLGRIVRDARLLAGLTQVQLAQKVGVTQGTISKLENGKATHLNIFPASIRACGLDIDVKLTCAKICARRPVQNRGSEEDVLAGNCEDGECEVRG